MTKVVLSIEEPGQHKSRKRNHKKSKIAKRLFNDTLGKLEVSNVGEDTVGGVVVQSCVVEEPGQHKTRERKHKKSKIDKRLLNDTLGTLEVSNVGDDTVVCANDYSGAVIGDDVRNITAPTGVDVKVSTTEHVTPDSVTTTVNDDTDTYTGFVCLFEWFNVR